MRQNETSNAENGKHSKQMENGFDRLISNLNLAKERIRESESSSIEVIPTEKQRENRMKKEQSNASKGCGTMAV